MSSGVIRYAFAATRARGMISRFLKPEDYQQFLKAQTLQDFERVLRKLYPNVVTTPVASRQSGRGEVAISEAPALEDKILGHHLDITRKICRSLPKAESQFLKALTLELEILNAKALLRSRILGFPTERIRAEIIPLGASAVWDWEALLAEDEIPEILRNLRTHPVGVKIEKAYLEHYLRTHNLFGMEAQIDIAYLSWLLDGCATFGGHERSLLQSLLGLRADVLNAAWILRLRENFKMEPEEIMVDLTPRGHFLDVRALKELVFAEDSKLLLALLRSYPWRRQLPADKLDLTAIEQGLDRYLKEEYHRMFRRHSMSFAGIVAFVLLSQSMAQNAVKILEATEYHLPRESVEAQLFYV